MRFLSKHAALAAVLLAALSSAAPLHTEALRRQDASGKLVFAHFMVRGWLQLLLLIGWMDVLI
jgi:hypothetical protein